ncbi:MAG TPA: hypothetical protein VLK33_19320, partial [Terriglobales bacterium]|nr:hypothetical protein [Terriglobales bacterium]
VDIDVGAVAVDLYDSVSNNFVARDVSQVTDFTVPPDSARILSLVPKSGSMTREGTRALINGITVDYLKPQ